MNRQFAAIATVVAILIGTSVSSADAQSISKATIIESTPVTASLRLTPTTRFTSTGERILNLDLLVNGNLVERVEAVSGKPGVQRFRTGRDSQAGSREPLPQGMYRVGAVDRQGGLPAAMGDTFIPLTPLFATSRSGIGIHRDADRQVRGGSGTIGCLGVLNQQGIDTVAEFVETYRVRTLTVDYGLPSGYLAEREK